MKIFLVSWTFCTYFTFNQAFAADIPFKINEQMAREILALAHDGNTKSEKYFDYDGDDSKISPPFFSYDLLGLNLDSLGFFSVNPWTGDVWALWECKKISTAPSRHLLQEIKKHFSPIELKSYAQLSRRKPECL